MISHNTFHFLSVGSQYSRRSYDNIIIKYEPPKAVLVTWTHIFHCCRFLAYPTRQLIHYRPFNHITFIFTDSAKAPLVSCRM